MSQQILIEASHVRKRFCRSLKKSLRYGVVDIASDLLGRDGQVQSLRSGEFWAVNDVSFQLKQGECLGLIGHNGAGKTTLLRMLSGLIRPDTGSIRMRGRIGALIALGAGFNPILSGRENIYVTGAIRGMKKAEIDSKYEEIVDFADLRDFIDSPVQTYSSGMVVRLGFAVATAWRPDILLLDEVLAVGDASFQAKSFNRIGEFRRNGTGFMLVSHNMHQITRFCDRTLYLSHGKCVFSGETSRAVELFQEEMMQFQSQNMRTGSDDARTGSGSVSIDEVYFIDDIGRPVQEIDSQSAITLCVQYRAKRQGIKNPVLDVTIRDSGDLCFQGTNRSFGVEFGELPATGTLKVRFACIPSNNQILRIGIALWDNALTELFDWKRDHKLKVKGDPTCTGRILLSAEWLLAPGNAPKVLEPQ